MSDTTEFIRQPSARLTEELIAAICVLKGLPVRLSALTVAAARCRTGATLNEVATDALRRWALCDQTDTAALVKPGESIFDPVPQEKLP